MEKRFTAGAEFHRIVEAFLLAAATYGGDPIAINLIKEHFIMAKILVIDTHEKAVKGIFGSQKKADEVITAAGEGHHLVVCADKEAFEALHEDVRKHIANSNENVATLPKQEKLERAYEVACAKPEAPAKPARAKGVKSLIRELFAVADARHSLEDIMKLTGGTKVSVTTAISDLRSTTYCKPGEPLSLTRLPDGNYALVSAEAAAAEKAKVAAEAEAAKAAKKAEAEAVKAEAAAKKAADKAAADAVKKAAKVETAAA